MADSPTAGIFDFVQSGPAESEQGGSVVYPVQFVPDSERQFTTDQRREFLRNLPTHPLLPPNETLGGIATGRIPGHGHLQGEAQDYLDQLDQHFQNNADKSLQEWWYHQKRWMEHKYGPEGHMRDKDDPENKSHIGIDSGDDKERDWRDRLQPRQYTPQPLPPTTRQRPAPANPGQQQIIPIPPGFMDRPEPEPPPTQMMQRGGPVHNPNDPKQIIANITQKYPKLAGYDWSIVDSRGKPGTVPGGQLEFYHADDPSNPTPGKPTIEVFNEKLQGPALEKAIFGDMLHHLPEVDHSWRRMRTNYLSSLTPEQKSIDQQAYQRDQKSYGEDREYDDWMEGSRLDAHIRGRLAPDEQDDWKNSYTDQQHQYLDQMEDYLTGSGQLRQYQEGGLVENNVLPDGTQMADKGDVRRLNEFGPKSVEDFLEQSPGFSPDDEFESLGFEEVQPYDFFVPQPNKEKQPNDGKPGEYWRRREPPPTSRAPGGVQVADMGDVRRRGDIVDYGDAVDELYESKGYIHGADRSTPIRPGQQADPSKVDMPPPRGTAIYKKQPDGTYEIWHSVPKEQRPMSGVTPQVMTARRGGVIAQSRSPKAQQLFERIRR